MADKIVELEHISEEVNKSNELLLNEKEFLMKEIDKLNMLLVAQQQEHEE